MSAGPRPKINNKKSEFVFIIHVVMDLSSGWQGGGGEPSILLFLAIY